MKTVKIKAIKRIQSDSKRYDIETKKTHNFFADGILVHNSCINLHYDWHKDEWFAATTGMAEGEGEINNRPDTSFNDLFWETIANKYDEAKFRANLDTRFVYVFELTTPYNIVVTPHGESTVTLLTIRNIETLKELNRTQCATIGDLMLRVPVVEEFDLNRGDVGHIMRTFEAMAYHEEGYVVVDEKFNRIKIKNPAYVAAHMLKGKSESHHILDIVKTNEVDEYAATFPERKEELLTLTENYKSLLEKLEVCWFELKEFKPKNVTPEEQKRFAMKLFEIVDKYDLRRFNGAFFSLKDGRIENVREYVDNMKNKELYQLLK